MTAQGWECEIAGVYREFNAAEAGEQAAVLRALHDALGSAPGVVGEVLGEPCDRTTFDRLLDSGCLHEAAFALIGRAGLMVSRTPAGTGHATLVADGLFAEVSFPATTVPLAIGGALAAGLASWADTISVPPLSRATH